MSSLLAFKKTLTLAALITGLSFGLVIESADAQQNSGRGDGQGLFKKPHRGPAIGGTSWTLSDVWGEPKMPEQSHDYPGFDYPPGGYDLNGPPSQAPYPN